MVVSNTHTHTLTHTHTHSHTHTLTHILLPNTHTIHSHTLGDAHIHTHSLKHTLKHTWRLKWDSRAGYTDHFRTALTIPLHTLHYRVNYA